MRRVDARLVVQLVEHRLLEGFVVHHDTLLNLLLVAKNRTNEASSIDLNQEMRRRRELLKLSNFLFCAGAAELRVGLFRAVGKERQAEETGANSVEVLPRY